MVPIASLLESSQRVIAQTLTGMSEATVDRYLSYLERAFLVFTLPNYSGIESSRQRRGRKLYFVDGAVRNAALQRGIAPLSDAAEMGVLTENLVAGHLHALAQQSQVRLYHWRDRNDEVDLIYDHPEQPLAFEIASSVRHATSSLHRFVERYPRFKGQSFLVAPDAPYLPASDANGGVGILPLDLLLLAIGAQTEKEFEKRLTASGLSGGPEGDRPIRDGVRASHRSPARDSARLPLGHATRAEPEEKGRRAGFSRSDRPGRGRGPGAGGRGAAEGGDCR
ncbi:MAG TPA: DUF4143 domain-containing protein [Gemmatimonadales bacterium]|nr:DUF4143 domain-containing protein [Gemmatimonadales bacterium]